MSASIHGRLRERLVKLWRLDGFEEEAARTWSAPHAGRAMTRFVRVKLVNATLMVTSLLLVLLVFVGRLVWPSKQLSLALVALAMVCAMTQAVTWAARLWLLLAVEGWSRTDGAPGWRADRPFFYWANAVATFIGLCVCLGAATYLALSAARIGARLGQ